MILVDKIPYKSIVVFGKNNELITIKEKDNVQFDLESGEVKSGKVMKFIGTKNDNLKLQILPTEKECEEIWPVVIIVEGTLKLIEETNEDNE